MTLFIYLVKGNHVPLFYSDLNLRTQIFRSMHLYFYSLPFKKVNSGKIYSSLIYDPALDYLGLIGLSETSCNRNLLIYWYAHVVFNLSRSN